MTVAVLTAHASFRVTTRDGFFLQWLEDQGLEISFAEDDHLLAADPDEGVWLELRAYPLDGGRATQVRWQLSQAGTEVPGESLLERLRSLEHQLKQDPQWHVDACREESQPQMVDPNPSGS